MTLMLVAIAIACVLTACAVRAPWSRPAALDVVVGEDILMAQTLDLNDAASLSPDRATAIAEQYVPYWQQAVQVSAKHVALTMHTHEGQVAWGLQARPVWLVTFTGTRYAPPGYPESGCPCEQRFHRPNTAVALDAQTGVLVVDYGFGAATSH